MAGLDLNVQQKPFIQALYFRLLSCRRALCLTSRSIADVDGIVQIVHTIQQEQRKDVAEQLRLALRANTAECLKDEYRPEGVVFTQLDEYGTTELVLTVLEELGVI